MTSVLICSDNVLVARLLGEHLSAAFGCTRVGIATSAAEALANVPRRSFQVLLADASTEDTVPLVRTISAEISINCLVFGLRKDMAEVAAFAEAGAIGLALRDADLPEISRVFDAVSAGECRCSSWIASALLRFVARTGRAPAGATAKQFTIRENEIARLLYAGHSNKEIARALAIEVATAKNHVHNILRKLDVPSRAKAVAELRHLGQI